MRKRALVSRYDSNNPISQAWQICRARTFSLVLSEFPLQQAFLHWLIWKFCLANVFTLNVTRALSLTLNLTDIYRALLLINLNGGVTPSVSIFRGRSNIGEQLRGLATSLANWHNVRRAQPRSIFSRNLDGIVLRNPLKQWRTSDRRRHLNSVAR